jgi:hypothetical protein
MLWSNFTFVKKNEPILKLKTNLSIIFDDELLKKHYNSVVIMYNQKDKIIILDTEKYSMELDQDRKKGVMSLLDLIGADIYITTNPLFGDLNPERCLLGINFRVGDRTIETYFFAYNNEKEFEKQLAARDIHPGDSPFFFAWDLDEPLLTGARTSLRVKDTVRMPAGVFYQRMTELK